MHVLLLLGSLNRTSVVETNPEVSFSTLKERPVLCRYNQHLTGTWYSFGPLGDRGPVSVKGSRPPPPLPPKEKKKVQERSVSFIVTKKERKKELSLQTIFKIILSLHRVFTHPAKRVNGYLHQPACLPHHWILLERRRSPEVR